MNRWNGVGKRSDEHVLQLPAYPLLRVELEDQQHEADTDGDHGEDQPGRLAEAADQGDLDDAAEERGAHEHHRDRQK